LSFVISSRLPVAAAVESSGVESAESMASSEMSCAETMPEEVVSPIVRTEATDVRTKKGITGASAEQKHCRCGN
jgi:hypothetical protein